MKKITAFQLLIHQVCVSIVITATWTAGFSFVFIPPVVAAPWDFWKSWFNAPPPPPRRGYYRGDAFCLIAPLINSEAVKVWSDRPSFVWQGAVARLQVLAEGSESPIWSKPISEADRIQPTTIATDQATYAVTMNQTLELGQTYKLRLYAPYTETPVTIDLQVLSSQEHERIQHDLQQFNGTDAAPVQRANYFAAQNLWLDFWQTNLSESARSEQWRNLNGNIIATLCPILETSGTLPAAGTAVTEEGRPDAEYRFEAKAGQTVEIALEHSGFDTSLTLTSPQGNLIEQTETIPGDRPYSQRITLPEDGKYTIRVEAIDSQKRGEYTLTVMSRFGMN